MARRFTHAAVCEYCAARPGSVKTTPFGPEPFVYKSNGLMFALVGHLDGQEVVSLKCDPERSMTLRGSFPAIGPGYHLHKLHWNTLKLDGTIPTPLIKELIDHAYELVTTARPRKRAPTKKRPRTRPTR